MGMETRSGRRGGFRPVVLVHGYRDDATVFRPMVGYLRRAGLRPYPITLRPSDGRAPLETLAQQLRCRLEQALGPEAPLDLVAFSMGGLVSRYYLQQLGGLHRVVHFVTLGTPHRGTWWAYGSRRPGVVQMRPGSAFLRALEQGRRSLEAVHFTNIWTPLDLMVVPARNASVPVGRDVSLLLPHHRALVTAPRALAWVCTALTRSGQHARP